MSLEHRHLSCQSLVQSFIVVHAKTAEESNQPHSYIPAYILSPLALNKYRSFLYLRVFVKVQQPGYSPGLSYASSSYDTSLPWVVPATKVGNSFPTACEKLHGAQEGSRNRFTGIEDLEAEGDVG